MSWKILYYNPLCDLKIKKNMYFPKCKPYDSVTFPIEIIIFLVNKYIRYKICIDFKKISPKTRKRSLKCAQLSDHSSI